MRRVVPSRAIGGLQTWERAAKGETSLRETTHSRPPFLKLLFIGLAKMEISNPQDKNNRPFCISLDWLSLSCHITGFLFTDREEQPSGYHLVHMEYGSKIFRHIAEIYDPDGELIGQLQWEPYSSALNPRLAIFKCDNALLYREGGIEQFFCAVVALHLEYRGINRLDIACDQNEFYGGLTPQNLIIRYFNHKYLKLGINHGFSHFDLNYYGVRGKHGLQAWSAIPLTSKEAREKYVKHVEERNREIAGTGVQPLKCEMPRRVESIKDEITNSVTWGTRGAGVQVQFYNKTKELQEVHMKRYIVEAWKAAGLDVSRDVYRVEMRIHAQGKGVVNLETGKPFELHMQDIMFQEQIEELFFAYAGRHFQFYISDGHVRKDQNKPLKLWNVRPPIIKPKLIKAHRNPSRFTLQIVNAVLREKAQAEKSGMTEAARMLEQVSKYLQNAYDLEAWVEYNNVVNNVNRKDLEPMPPEARAVQAWGATEIAGKVIERVTKWRKKNREHVEATEITAEERHFDSVIDMLSYTEYLYIPPLPNDVKVDWDNISN